MFSGCCFSPSLAMWKAAQYASMLFSMWAYWSPLSHLFSQSNRRGLGEQSKARSWSSLTDLASLYRAGLPAWMLTSWDLSDACGDKSWVMFGNKLLGVVADLKFVGVSSVTLSEGCWKA